METIKLILADSSEITINEYSLPMDVVIVGTHDDLVNIWESFTQENLTSIVITVNDVPTVAMNNAVLESVQFIANPDGAYTAHFYFGGAIENAETEYELAAKILLGEVE